MPTKLTADDVAIISKAVQGQSLSPVERKRIDFLAGVSVPSDPNYQAITTAYAAAHHTPALPSATSAPSSPKPATPVGDLTTGNAAPQPNSPAAVAAKIAAGQYAGKANNGSPPSVAAAQAEIKADQGTSDIPGQSGGGLLFGGHQPTLDWVQNLINQPQDASQQGPSFDWGGVGSTFAPSPLGVQDAATSNAARLPDTGQFAWRKYTSPGPSFDPNTQLLGDYSGYTFANKNQAQRDFLFSDPSGPGLEALALAQQAGGGDNTANMLTPYVQAAMMLAGTGALAGGSDPTATSGPASSAAQLKAVEDFINQINQPGGGVDPTQFTQTVLQRLANTPTDEFSKLASLGLSPAGDTTPIDDQITATNNAMKAAAQLSYAPDSQAQLAKVLDMAQIQYKQMILADPTITLTYPAYLQTFIPQMFGS